MIKLTMEQAKTYFDAKPAVTRAEWVERRFLGRYGAFVRKESRSSIRKRKAASQPGSAPSSHKGYLKNNIVFVVDRSAGDVWIFPTVFKRSTDTPGQLEKGGKVRIAKPLVRFVRGGKFLPGGRKKKYKSGTVDRVVVQPGTHEVKERPYMIPAKQKVDNQLDSIWAYARNT